MPDTTGAAIDVPEWSANPPSIKGSAGELAANILTPGAAISGCNYTITGQRARSKSKQKGNSQGRISFLIDISVISLGNSQGKTKEIPNLENGWRNGTGSSRRKGCNFCGHWLPSKCLRRANFHYRRPADSQIKIKLLYNLQNYIRLMRMNYALMSTSTWWNECKTVFGFPAHSPPLHKESRWHMDLAHQQDFWQQLHQHHLLPSQQMQLL